MDRCPICRNRAPAAECSRCGADLSSLLRLEQQAQRLVESGITLLRLRHYEGALQLLSSALRQQYHPLTEKLAAMAGEAQLKAAIAAMLRQDWAEAKRSTESLLRWGPREAQDQLLAEQLAGFIEQQRRLRS
ncbi:MAG: hypothetical protein HQL48_05755 [Gammaproteobacteria bacterium]|nr:hypothetical protein [Gammaproteobacteria bacterium]